MWRGNSGQLWIEQDPWLEMYVYRIDSSYTIKGTIKIFGWDVLRSVNLSACRCENVNQPKKRIDGRQNKNYRKSSYLRWIF